jgi:hypothetical protein
MDTHRFALFRGGLFVSAACCLSIGVYVGMPSGLFDVFSKVGADAQLPLEALAVDQVKVDDVIAPAPRESRSHSIARRPSRGESLMQPHMQATRTTRGQSQGDPHHQEIWKSRDASAARAIGRDAHERKPGVVRSIHYEDFKHWT